MLIFLKKNFFKLFFLFIIILIFIVQNDILRKTFFVFNREYHDRIAKKYDFCDNESIGFINFLKKKYFFKNNTEIINYKKAPSGKWFLNEGPQSKLVSNINSYLIVLNYDNNKKQKNKINLTNYIILEKYKDCFLLKTK